MITAVGLAADPTIRYFCVTAAGMGASIELIDLAGVIESEWHLSLPCDRGSWISQGSGPRRFLDPHASYYCRLIDLGAVSPTETVAWRTVITAFGSWMELCPGTVVNRPGHVNDNACKPLHEARLASLGFSVPPSFTGSSRSDLRAFASKGKVVAKALCGQRADCRVLTVGDFDDYDERSGPVHLQRFVAGDDVRAHVIGNEVVAVRIRSLGSDYRIDDRAVFEPFTVESDVADRLRIATRTFGLSFAGWDLRIGANEWWVLEANPMPGYSYYDTKLGGQITRTLISFFEKPRNGDQ